MTKQTTTKTTENKATKIAEAEKAERAKIAADKAANKRLVSIKNKPETACANDIENLDRCVSIETAYQSDVIDICLREMKAKFITTMKLNAKTFVSRLDDAKNWRGLSEAYNTGRMSLFAARVTSPEHQLSLALIDWKTAEDHTQYTILANIIKVTDKMTAKGLTYECTLTKQFTNECSYYFDMVREDASRAVKVLTDMDVEAYREWRAEVRQARAEVNAAKAQVRAAAAQGSQVPVLADDASEQAVELFNKCLSMMRLVAPLDESESGRNTMAGFAGEIDDMVKDGRDFLRGLIEETHDDPASAEQALAAVAKVVAK